jgi:glycosyltransferase involved in cell wall biosynthesis
VEVLVVDNYLPNHARPVVEGFAASGFRYVHEEREGLSHARNRGALEAAGSWLCYIDDDAKLRPDYLARLQWVVLNFEFDCFGGMYFAWYPSGKPAWLSTDFGTKIPLRDEVGYVEVPELSGGNFCIKKEALIKADLFPLGFGMRGKRIAYGEEDLLQLKLLRLGFKLGFDPLLIVDHAVLPMKLKLSWQLMHWYAHGRDGIRVLNKYNLLQVFLLTAKSMGGSLVKFPFCLAALFRRKNYYWQNFIWDVFSPLLYRAGQIVGSIQ